MLDCVLDKYAGGSMVILGSFRNLMASNLSLLKEASGPKTDPCGTPETTVYGVESTCSTLITGPDLRPILEKRY